MASGGSGSGAKSAKLLAYEQQIDQARCQGNWALIRDRLAGKHEKYSGKAIFKDFITAEAILGQQLSPLLKEHPDYDVAPTLLPRAPNPKDFARPRELLLKAIEKSGGTKFSMKLDAALQTFAIKRPRSPSGGDKAAASADAAAPAGSSLAPPPSGSQGPSISITTPSGLAAPVPAGAPAPRIPPLDVVRQCHILLAKMDLLVKGDPQAALTALQVADLPDDLPDSPPADSGWTNAMKVLVAEGWVLRGLAYHLQSEFAASFSCFDRVFGWYCQKLSPVAAALDPSSAGSGRGLRIPSTVSVSSTGVVPMEDRPQVPTVDVSAVADQWVYWCEEASWRRLVQMVLRLGADAMPAGSFAPDEVQNAVTLHLNLFPPPSAQSSKGTMLMRSRYILPLRERLKYLVTHLGGFCENGTPPSGVVGSGRPSPVYGLTHGGRIKPNVNTIVKRVGSWELEAQTLLVSYEECVTGITEFPKAIRDDKEEQRYARVKECFEWRSMVNWEATLDPDGDDDEDYGGPRIPEIEKWRKAWLTVEESYRAMYHSFNHLPFFRALIHSFGYLADHFPDSFSDLDKKEVRSMVETYLQLWVDACQKELVEAKKKLEDEEHARRNSSVSAGRQPSTSMLSAQRPKPARASTDLPVELSSKFAEDIWQSNVSASMGEAATPVGPEADRPATPGPSAPNGALTPETRPNGLVNGATTKDAHEAADGPVPDDPPPEQDHSAKGPPYFAIPPDLGLPVEESPAAMVREQPSGDAALYESSVPLAWIVKGSGETLPCYLGVVWDVVRMFICANSSSGTLNQSDADLYDWALDLARKSLTHVLKARPNAPSQREYELCEAEARWILGIVLCEWSSSRCTVDPAQRTRALEEGLDELAAATKLLEGEPREWECLYSQALGRCTIGQVDIAIGLLRRCLQLQPTSIPVWHLLVLALSASPTKLGNAQGASTIPEAWTLAETAWKELVVEGDTWSLIPTSRKVELLKLRCSAMWILRAFKGPTKSLEECRHLLSLFAKMFPSVMTTDERTLNTLLRSGKVAAPPSSVDSSTIQSPTLAVAALAGSTMPRQESTSLIYGEATRASGPAAAEVEMADLRGAPSPTFGSSVGAGFSRTVSLSSINTSGGASSAGILPSAANSFSARQRLKPIPFVADHMTNTYQFAPYDLLLHLWLSASFLYRDLVLPDQALAALDEAFKVVTDIQRREIRKADGPSTLNLLTGIVDATGHVKARSDSASPLPKKRPWRYDMAPRRVRRCIADVEVEWTLAEMLRRVKELNETYTPPDPLAKYKTATDIVEEELRNPPKRPPAPVGFNLDTLHDGPPRENVKKLFASWETGNGNNVNAALKLPLPDPLAPPPNDPTLIELIEHLRSLSLVADQHQPLRILLGRLYFYQRQAAESEYWSFRATQDDKMQSAAMSGEYTALAGNWWSFENWLWNGRILAEIGQMRAAHPALLHASKLDKTKPAREWGVVGRLI
ncbi:hypothetical protein DFJ74DRAFT_455979 [Hyaloraphidium curvatum]|nr:hypothetical protein DFJ74DRAFT_455979 [Hyaloraphidium curvatum]